MGYNNNGIYPLLLVITGLYVRLVVNVLLLVYTVSHAH